MISCEPETWHFPKSPKFKEKKRIMRSKVMVKEDASLPSLQLVQVDVAAKA